MMSLNSIGWGVKALGSATVMLGRGTLAGVALSGWLCAESAEALSPQERFLAAVRRAPVVAAAAQRVDAERWRVEAAGRWADPEVEGMAAQSTSSSSGERWELTVRQPLSRSGERSADRQRARANAGLAEAEYGELSADLASELAAGLAEAAAARERVRVMQQQRERLQVAKGSVESRLSAAGRARLADRLAIESRLTALRLEEVREERRAIDAEMSVRADLGLADADLLPDFAAPTLAQLDVAHSPAQMRVEARVAEADAAARLAQTATAPATSVGLRLERERTMQGRDDMAGLMFSTDLPFQRRRSARIELRAVDAMRAAAVREAEAVASRARAAVARWERAVSTLTLVRQLTRETRERLQGQQDALLRAVGVGGGEADSPILSLVDLFDQQSELDRRLIEVEAEARIAQAALWRYVASRPSSAP